jgi:hypothetical protein
MDAKPPFTFGIGLQGELVVGFSLSGLPMFLVIPAEELETLRRGLEQSRTIQETLSAKLPPQGAH